MARCELVRFGNGGGGWGDWQMAWVGGRGRSAMPDASRMRAGRQFVAATSASRVLSLPPWTIHMHWFPACPIATAALKQSCAPQRASNPNRRANYSHLPLVRVLVGLCAVPAGGILLLHRAPQLYGGRRGPCQDPADVDVVVHLQVCVGRDGVGGGAVMPTAMLDRLAGCACGRLARPCCKRLARNSRLSGLVCPSRHRCRSRQDG